ncbi:gliding motility lipoprotein GldB [Flectobacillus roseus]|uniref:gliding motility lipoprotein GldB n=1 Tax=Flectobacillus roseus TaxID=502259 RepID=UPI0024B7A98F|nr:gliding motility protein [Flectobacillus roseus]MDI9869920.1 gliding motility protein [Flectobacillus roseus]
MKIFAKIGLLFLVSVCLWACNNNTDGEPDVSNVKVDVKIQYLDKELFACKTEQDVLVFLQKYTEFASQYFNTTPASFPVLANKLFAQISSPALQEFYQQSQEKAFFGNQNLENDFKEAFQHIKYYYPDFKEPKIYTIFTGFFGQGTILNPELRVSDSTIIVGIDYFMGEKGKYLPDIYDYQIKKISPAVVVPQAILQLSSRYNTSNPQDRTLLAEMVWYGKSYVFGKVMMPSKADSVFLGYSNEQLNATYANQEVVWAYFIDNKLLYSTQDPAKGKYIGERPSTPEIGPACPGGIGRWIGFRIVSKYYYDDEKLTIQDLMKEPDAQRIFEASKYKGLPDEE